MSLYRRKRSPYWWSSLPRPGGGDPLQFSTKKKKKGDAYKVERDAAAELGKAKPDSVYVELAWLAAEFLVHRKTDKNKPISPAWLETLERYLEKLIVPYFGATADVSVFDSERLEGYRDSRLQVVEAVSVCKELTAIRQLIKYAVKRKLIPSPAPVVANPHCKYEPKWRLLTDDELSRILYTLQFRPVSEKHGGKERKLTDARVAEAAGRVEAGEKTRALAKRWGIHHSTLQSALVRYRRRAASPYGNRGAVRDRELFPYFLLRANTGLRGAEVDGLEWPMVDWPQRVLRLPGRITKTRRPRDIDLNDQALAALQLLGDEHSTGKIFHQKKHYGGWHSAVGRAGIKGRVRPHDLRHTIGTRLHAKGASLPTIRDLLGHATLMMANLYAHSYDEERKRAAEMVAIGPAIGEKIPPVNAPADSKTAAASRAGAAPGKAEPSVEKNVEKQGREMLSTAHEGDRGYKIAAEAKKPSNRN